MLWKIHSMSSGIGLRAMVFQGADNIEVNEWHNLITSADAACFSQVISVLMLCIDKLDSTNKKNVLVATGKRLGQLEDQTDLMKLALNLVQLFDRVNKSADEKLELNRIVERLVLADVQLPDGQTPLHLAADHRTSFILKEDVAGADDDETEYVQYLSEFPSTRVTTVSKYV